MVLFAGVAVLLTSFDTFDDDAGFFDDNRDGEGFLDDDLLLEAAAADASLLEASLDAGGGDSDSGSVLPSSSRYVLFLIASKRVSTNEVVSLPRNISNCLRHFCRSDFSGLSF